MPRKCIVKNCQPQSLPSDEYISYFRLPRDKAMRKEWLNKLGEVRNLSKIRYPKICSAHFSADSFVDPTVAKLKISDWDTVQKARRHLRPNAVPTLNLNPTARNNHSTRKIGESTVVQRSQRLSTTRKRKIIENDQHTENHEPNETSSSLKCGKKGDQEGYGKDESSLSEHTQRPMMKSLDNNFTDVQWNPKVEEFENMITELIKKLQYTESLVNFYQNSACDDRKEILDLKAQCAAFAAQIKEQQTAKDEPSIEMKKLQELNDKLQNELTSAKADMKRLTERQQDTFASILKAYFTDGQIRCIIEGNKQTAWSVDDFATAISLRSVSPRAYRYLRNVLNIPLPSLLSLRQWALVKFDMSEGFLSDVLTVMREKSRTVSEIERLAVITFAEMSLAHEICLNSKSQRIIGPCTKVLVIMARGLLGNWKQPVYYKFDQPMTKAILNEAITLLDSAGYQVVAATCDIGNERVWSKLGITAEKHYIPHPVRTDEIIYAFADVPHLLKLIRNSYMDDGFSIQGCIEPLTCDVLRNIVYRSTDPSESPIAHKLTQRVIDARIDQSQAVWPAARIWSRTTAKSVEQIGKRNLSGSKDYQKYSDFILAVNNWFDVHNSNYGVDEDNQEMKLVLMTSHMESMRVGSQRKVMPFQEGVIISNASLRGLHGYLKEKFPNDYEHVITRRLQQDVLENFFTYIRAMDATDKLPSPYEFRCRLRWYILGVESHAVFENNLESEEDTGVYRTLSSCSTASTLKKRPDISQPLKPPNSRFNDNEIESSSLSSITSVFQSHNSLETEYEYEPDSDAEILLTEELFLEIMNMSPFLASAEMEKNCSMDNFEDNLHELDEIDEVQQLGSIREKYAAEDCSGMIADEGLTYVAGYVAHRFRNKYPCLGEQTHYLKDSTPNELLDWIQAISKGHFLYPSRELLQAVQIVEECFTNFHKAEFSTEEKVIEKVVLMAKSQIEYPDNIPDEVLQCLVRTRTYVRIREMNKRMFAKDTEVQDGGNKQNYK